MDQRSYLLAKYQREKELDFKFSGTRLTDRQYKEQLDIQSKRLEKPKSVVEQEAIKKSKSSEFLRQDFRPLGSQVVGTQQKKQPRYYLTPKGTKTYRPEGVTAPKGSTEISREQYDTYQPSMLRSQELFVRQEGSKEWLPRKDLIGQVSLKESEKLIEKTYTLGGREISKGFADLYKSREKDIFKLKEIESVSGGSPFLEKVFYPYGKQTRGVEELGKFGRLYSKPYGNLVTFSPPPISAPPRTYEQKLSTSKSFLEGAKLTVQEQIKNPKQALINVGIGVGAGALVAGTGGVGAALATGAGVVYGGTKIGELVSLKQRGVSKGRYGAFVTGTGLELAEFGVGARVGSGAVNALKVKVPLAVKQIKLSRLLKGQKATKDLILKPDYSPTFTSKEISTQLVVKDLLGYKAVRTTKTKGGKLFETTKYVPKYSQPYLAEPSKLPQPTAMKILSTAEVRGISTGKLPKYLKLTGKELTPRPLTQSYDTTINSRVFVKGQALKDLSKPIITKKILDYKSPFTIRERGVSEGVFLEISSGKMSGFTGRGKGYGLKTPKVIDLTKVKALPGQPQLSYQYKLPVPKRFYKPLITESGVAIGSELYVGGKFAKFVTAGKPKGTQTQPFKWLKRVTEPKRSVEIIKDTGTGQQLILKLEPPKIVQAVKLTSKVKLKTVQRPLAVSRTTQLKTKTTTKTFQKTNLYKVFETRRTVSTKNVVEGLSGLKTGKSLSKRLLGGISSRQSVYSSVGQKTFQSPVQKIGVSVKQTPKQDIISKQTPRQDIRALTDLDYRKDYRLDRLLKFKTPNIRTPPIFKPPKKTKEGKFPFLFDLYGRTPGLSSSRYLKRVSRYAPSVVARVYNIRGRKPKRLTGFGIRPLLR